jgi:iron complex outermembrane recepter protein
LKNTTGSTLGLLAATSLLATANVHAATPTDAKAAPADDTLEQIEVIAQRQAFRGDTPLQELPQSVQVLPAEIIQAVGATQLDTVLDLASGVARQNTFGGLWDSFAIRGFAGDENTPSGYLVNGFNAGRGFSGRRDASNIESIEVLKGPGSALYGRSEPGGTINLVTKKPRFKEAGSIDLSAGSFSTYRGAFDYTNGIGSRVAIRLNGAYEDAGSFRDFFTSKKQSFTPSVLVKIADKTSLTYELEYVDQRAPFDRGVAASAEGQVGIIPVSRFLGEPGDGDNQIHAIGHQLTLNHEFNDSWSLLVGASQKSSSFKGFSSDPELVTGRQAFYQVANPATHDILVSRQRRYRDFSAKDSNARAELSGRFETGSLVNHLLAGVDYYNYDLETLQNRFRPNLANPNGINVFNPVYGQLPTPGPFTNTLEKQKATGFYVQDQIDLTEQWKVLGGVRIDHWDQNLLNRVASATTTQTKSATSPRVGVVYEPSKQVSVYASYSKGFRPNSGSNALNEAFAPEFSSSYEIGTKLQSADGTMSGTIAVYDAKKSNMLTSDPVNSGFSIAAGEAESKGLELDFTGSLTEHVKLMASYAYTDAKITKSVLDVNFGFALPVGAQLINIPKSSGNVLLTHDVMIGDHAFTYGGQVTYVGERLGETGVPSFQLPAYALFNVLANFAVSDKLKLSLNINNLTNKEYYPSSYARLWVAPGTPRSATLRLHYQFR